MSTDADRGRSGRVSKARALLGALSLLVVGAVLGIVIDRHLLTRDHGSMASAFHEMTMSSLQDRLDLSPQQLRQIDSIVMSRHNSLRHAWQALHTQLGAAVDTVHEEIEAVLTPEQQAAFREWLREVNPGG